MSPHCLLCSGDHDAQWHPELVDLDAVRERLTNLTYELFSARLMEPFNYFVSPGSWTFSVPSRFLMVGLCYESRSAGSAASLSVVCEAQGFGSRFFSVSEGDSGGVVDAFVSEVVGCVTALL